MTNSNISNDTVFHQLETLIRQLPVLPEKEGLIHDCAIDLFCVKDYLHLDGPRSRNRRRSIGQINKKAERLFDLAKELQADVDALDHDLRQLVPTDGKDGLKQFIYGVQGMARWFPEGKGNRPISDH